LLHGGLVARFDVVDSVARRLFRGENRYRLPLFTGALTMRLFSKYSKRAEKSPDTAVLSGHRCRLELAIFLPNLENSRVRAGVAGTRASKLKMQPGNRAKAKAYFQGEKETLPITSG
jgi:hypothetical protein